MLNNVVEWSTYIEQTNSTFINFIFIHTLYIDIVVGLGCKCADRSMEE